MAKNHKEKHGKYKKEFRHQHAVDTKMDVEFGAEFLGDAKRAAHVVETRVKSNAQRYGFCQED